MEEQYMKKLIITALLFFAFIITIQSQSYKFVAMDGYYDRSIPIDSIIVHDMNTGEDETYYSDSVYFSALSSVHNFENDNLLKLYPNPVEDVLNIELPNLSNSALIISDVSGRVYFNYEAISSQKLTLNIAGLNTGVYSISYGKYNQKFIKGSAGNSSIIDIISAQNMYNSLIK